MLRVGIAGFGKIGQLRAKAVEEIDNAELIAIYDITSPKRIFENNTPKTVVVENTKIVRTAPIHLNANSTKKTGIPTPTTPVIMIIGRCEGSNSKGNPIIRIPAKATPAPIKEVYWIIRLESNSSPILLYIVITTPKKSPDTKIIKSPITKFVINPC